MMEHSNEQHSILKGLLMATAFIAVLLCLSAFASDSEAAEGENTLTIDGLIYQLEGDGTATVIGYVEGAYDSLTIPDAIPYNGVSYTVDTIADFALKGINVTHLYIGKNMADIGTGALSYVANTMFFVHVDDDNPVYKRVSNKILTKDGKVLVASGGLSVGTIPDTVEEIADYAFAGMDASHTTLTTLPMNVKRIGDYAFADFVGLYGLLWNVSNVSLEYIGEHAFDGCENFRGFITYGYQNEYVIPHTVTYIGDYAFSGTAMTEATIRDQDTSDSQVSANVTIGNYAFSGCSQLTKVNLDIPGGSIGENVFDGCPIEELALNNISVPDGYFAGNTTLKTVRINGSSTEGEQMIGARAFAGCTSLETLDLSGVKGLYMKDSAFEGCTSLTAVDIPDRCEVIGDRTFYGCSSVKTLSIGSGLGEAGVASFAYMTSLETIAVSASNEYFSTDGYLLYGGTTLITTTSDVPDDTVKVKDGTIVIAAWALVNDRGIIMVYLPDSVTTLVQYAFADTPSLSVAAVENVTSVGECAFSGSGLLQLTFGDLVYLGDRAFYDMPNLTDLGFSYVPEEIAPQAFVIGTTAAPAEVNVVGIPYDTLAQHSDSNTEFHVLHTLVIYYMGIDKGPEISEHFVDDVITLSSMEQDGMVMTASYKSINMDSEIFVMPDEDAVLVLRYQPAGQPDMVFEYTGVGIVAVFAAVILVLFTFRRF